MNKNLTKILASFIFTTCVFLISPRQILATTDFPGNPDKESISGKVFNPVLPEGLSQTTGPAFLQSLLQGGIRLFFVAGAIIFFFMLLIGGIGWISAGGDKARLEGAQKRITHALIGLAILLSTFAIIELVGYLFGIDLLKITLPTL